MHQNVAEILSFRLIYYTLYATHKLTLKNYKKSFFVSIFFFQHQVLRTNM